MITNKEYETGLNSVLLLPAELSFSVIFISIFLTPRDQRSLVAGTVE